MTADATQCERMALDAAQAAAQAAARHAGISIEIKLLCADGYRLWTWAGTVPDAMTELAAAVPMGMEQ